MARSKSKHVRLIMRRRKQWKQRTKRRKAEAKAHGGVRPKQPARVVKKAPPPPPPAAAPSEPQH
jgi:hypothetical protein